MPATLTILCCALARLLPVCLAGMLSFQATGIAQDTTTAPNNPFRIEAHVGGGPFLSAFRRSGFPKTTPPITYGYTVLARLMWHPDHYLAIGLLTGTERVFITDYVVADSELTSDVHAELSTTPIMIDETMNLYGIEAGVALGGFIVSSLLNDVTISRASRLEFGIITHAAYRWNLVDRLSAGVEVCIQYMSYRGIFSVAPIFELTYDGLKY
jgi:hypothetical protein